MFELSFEQKNVFWYSNFISEYEIQPISECIVMTEIQPILENRILSGVRSPSMAIMIAADAEQPSIAVADAEHAVQSSFLLVAGT